MYRLCWIFISLNDSSDQALQYTDKMLYTGIFFMKKNFNEINAKSVSNEVAISRYLIM